MIKNLVIGSDGFVGKYFCTYLEKKGEKVIHFDIKKGKKEDARIVKLPKADRVYFLAWDVGGAKYLNEEKTQLFQLKWNIDLLNNVMKQLEINKTPFIFISSQLAEEDTVYGLTKRLGELWTRQLKGVCVRLWNVYGQQEKTTERSHVVGDFVNQAKRTKKIKMLTTGEEKRQFIYIDDVCEALHYALDNNLNEEIYDITSYEWVSIKKVAEIIANYTGAKIIPGKLEVPIKSKTVVKGKILNWIPQITLEEGLKKMI